MGGPCVERGGPGVARRDRYEAGLRAQRASGRLRGPPSSQGHGASCYNNVITALSRHRAIRPSSAADRVRPGVAGCRPAGHGSRRPGSSPPAARGDPGRRVSCYNNVITAPPPHPAPLVGTVTGRAFALRGPPVVLEGPLSSQGHGVSCYNNVITGHPLHPGPLAGAAAGRGLTARGACYNMATVAHEGARLDSFSRAMPRRRAPREPAEWRRTLSGQAWGAPGSQL
jgi:hypothetical protein